MSSLTETQLQILLMHSHVKSGKMRVKDALQITPEKRISRGTYYRILSQSKSKLRKSLINLIIGSMTGHIDTTSVIRLLNLVNGKGPEELNRELVTVLSEIVRRIVE